MPPIFTETYHESVSIAGLHFLALGIGMSGASQIDAGFMDRVYVYFKGRNEGVGEPEFQLREFQVFVLPMSVGIDGMVICQASMGLGSVILPVGLFMAGWAAEWKVHWIVVDVVR